MTIILAGIATCTAGVVGGIAVNPVMLPMPGSDWRERYRAPVNAASDPVVDEYALGGWRELFTQAEQPTEPPQQFAYLDAQPMSSVPLEGAVMDNLMAAADDDGRSAVASALAATAAIGAPAQTEPEAAAEAAEPAAVDEDALPPEAE